MTNIAAKTVVTVLAGLVMLEAGCSRTPALSPRAAAQLAANLANEECDSEFQERPFSASQHPAILRNGIYEWGGLDVTGPHGFSAFVSFRTDGGSPQIEVFFLHDPLPPIQSSPMPQRHLPPPPAGIPAYLP